MKRILLSILVIGILLLSACGAPTTMPEGEAPHAPTVKIAVFNDCENDIVDAQIVINDEVVKHIAIYNGYWADFGSYQVTNSYRVTIRAFRYHAVSGKRVSQMEKTVDRTGSANFAFMANEEEISVQEYPSVTLEAVPAEIPKEVAVTPGNKPEDMIPLSVEGFEFVEKSDFVRAFFAGEEYYAYSFFWPKEGSKFADKVDSLEVRVHKFVDEKSAQEAGSAYAQDGVMIQLQGKDAILSYDEAFGEAAVSWQEGKLVILSDAIPPFEAATYEESVLKDAAMEGAKAVAKKL